MAHREIGAATASDTTTHIKKPFSIAFSQVVLGLCALGALRGIAVAFSHPGDVNATLTDILPVVVGYAFMLACGTSLVLRLNKPRQGFRRLAMLYILFSAFAFPVIDNIGRDSHVFMNVLQMDRDILAFEILFEKFRLGFLLIGMFALFDGKAKGYVSQSRAEEG